jgi:hypothetical protein
MIALLKEYSDCFAWDYTEMPGLDRSIVEHRLLLKKEIEKMLEARFIRSCRYAEWISNIVPVQKKDGWW